jgi:NodT family efflux transporter outer membrane factor (OMF) lipoprotein
MRFARRCLVLLCLGAVASLAGCTSLPDYVHHGFKVGPEYCGARAAVAPQWIDAADSRVRSTPADLSRWWTVFNDPVLNDLVYQAYSQNITLKEAGARVLQARAAVGIATGELFPQSQFANGSYTKNEASITPFFPPVPKFTDNWNFGFSLAWELDFWGRFRRAVKSTDDQFEGSVEDYDAALVTLVGDVASNYVQMRQSQEQIVLAQQNVKLQSDVLKIAAARLDAGRATELDVDQAQTTLSQTKATIPAFEIIVRESQNAICTLLGIPSTDLQSRLGERPIPPAPLEAVVGIPANLLERRPDVRRAERNAAAQCEQIGIAQSDWYPHISILGTLGYSATSQSLSQLFKPDNQFGAVGPSFQWNILQYGRIANNVRLQDAKFQETLLTYRATVLNANREAEDGLVTYLRAQVRADLLRQSVIAASKAYGIVVSQYQAGRVDFTTVSTIEQTLVQQQDLYTQSLGQIDQGLIQVYRALGGGWEIRLGSGYRSNLPPPTPAPPGAENKRVPTPGLESTETPTPRANPEPIPPPKEELKP